MSFEDGDDGSDGEERGHHREQGEGHDAEQRAGTRDRADDHHDELWPAGPGQAAGERGQDEERGGAKGGEDQEQPRVPERGDSVDEPVEGAFTRSQPPTAAAPTRITQSAAVTRPGRSCGWPNHDRLARARAPTASGAVPETRSGAGRARIEGSGGKGRTGRSRAGVAMVEASVRGSDRSPDGPAAEP
jgi:hypothetical protein